MPRLPARNGWTCEALDRCLHLKGKKYLLVFADQYLFIRQCRLILWMWSVCRLRKVLIAKPKESKASDTMGTKHRVGFGVYVVKGSVNVSWQRKRDFHRDAELLKEALKTLFENDASSARPEGSMEVCRMYWWQHKEKTPANLVFRKD